MGLKHDPAFAAVAMLAATTHFNWIGTEGGGGGGGGGGA